MEKSESIPTASISKNSYCSLIRNRREKREAKDEPEKRKEREPVLDANLVVLIEHQEPNGSEEGGNEGPDEGGDGLVADERLEGDVTVVAGRGEPGVGAGEEEGNEEDGEDETGGVAFLRRRGQQCLAVARMEKGKRWGGREKRTEGHEIQSRTVQG